MIKRSLAVLGAVCLFSVTMLGQGLSTNASKDDWEEINFEFNSAILSDGYPSLLRLAELLNRNPGYRVRVVGHTDYVGSAQYNEKLALARGNTVRDFLLKYGANANQISVSGQGEREPAVPNQTKEGRFMNRRVVLTVTDDQGRTVAAGGVGEAIQAMPGWQECCDNILKRLDRLDEILAALRDLKGEGDKLRSELNELRTAQSALRQQVEGLPRPLTAEQTTQIAREEQMRGLDEAARRNQKFSLLGLNIGPTFGDGRTGDWTFSGKGRFFSPFATGRPPGALGTHAVQIEGEYMYYGGGRRTNIGGFIPPSPAQAATLANFDLGSRQEGQFDIGLVNRWGRVQAGLFSSFKYVNFANLQSGGTLGQGAFTFDYIFGRGRVGVFGTKGFRDTATLNRMALGPTSFIEHYLQIVDQAGASAQIGAWGDSYFEANAAYLRSRGPAPDRPGGMVRFVAPVHQNFALTAEAGLNETFINRQMNGRLVFGFQFGNWMRPRQFLETQQPVPVDIPRLRYELATRRVGNSAPIADAGPDRIGIQPGPVTLDGTGSRDPDGDPLTFRWEQIGGPTVSLSGMNTAVASFTAAANQTYIFRLTVTDSGGLSDTARVMVTTSTGEAPRIGRFQAVPATVAAGACATLVWSVEGAQAVEITGLGPVAATGSSQVCPTQTTTYRLTARNAAGEVNESIAVTVQAQARILRFQATPTNIARGEAATLSWETDNAEQVSISPGIGPVSPNGSTTVSPTETTTYTLTARGRDGEVNTTVTVTVTTAGARILSFFANPTSIEPGGTTQLCWNVEGATQVTISPAVPGFPGGQSGCVNVSPTQTTAYVLTARDAGGTTTTAGVTVVVGGARIISFVNAPDFSIRAGDPVVLTWTTQGASSVTITGLGAPTGALPASGSITVNPTTNTTYTLIAYGPNGSTSAVLYVFVR